jgi:glyoxylase-like metal-dependent hydrolase (beta-lactamase superfamily II)
MCPSGDVDITVLREGDRLKVGEYNLEVVDLPGHTPGQIGLWEADKGYLFSGDHILSDISPNISAWDLEVDYLDVYAKP